MTAEIEFGTPTPGPEILPGDAIVEDALTEVGHAMGRYMDPTPISHELLDRESVASDEKIAEILSRVKDDSPKIDPTTEQGIAEAAENMIGRAEAAIGQATDPVVKREIKKFEKKGARGVASFLSKPVNFGRRHFLKAVSAGALAAVLASCAPNVIGPVIIPDGGGGAGPTSSEAATIPTETTAPTPTEVATPTPEVIPVFIPEGFSEGPAGLLRNPETGQDVLQFNPEADWKQTRESIIGGLWEINTDWSKWTGQTTDATNYNTKEEFIRAALEGKKFHIGIPVRLDGSLLTDQPDNKRFKSRLVVFEMVDVRLDSIQIQILSAGEFIRYTGKDWGADTQPAFDCAALSPSSAVGGANACLFTTDQETLIISIGSFYQGEQVVSSRVYNVGSFEKNLHEKYSTYFREDGIGVDADTALAFTLGYLLDAFPNFENAHRLTPHWTKDKNIRMISVAEAQVIPDQNAFYLNPSLFKFSP